MNSYPRYPDRRGTEQRVAIGGCGRTGAEIATAASQAGKPVQILDLTPGAFDRLPTRMTESGQIMPVVGDVRLESHLRRVATRDPDVFIAVTGSDSVNVTAAQIALHILRIPTVICRIDDPIKRDLYERLGLTTISPANVVRDLVTGLL